MHDLHLANKILNLVLEEGKKNNLKEIVEIKIELGKIIEHNQCITPENLKFNLKILTKGTIAENAKIKIDSIKNKFIAFLKKKAKNKAFVLKEIIGK